MNLNTAGWASPLLRLVARLRSDGINSTTPVTEINGGTISAADADVALVAKGTGATLAQVPDGTIAGGNKRGQYATDWQKFRNTATQVASGLRAVITGGSQNTASGTGSFVGAGISNTASSLYSFVGAGSTNNASGTYTVIGGGDTNTASSNFSFVGGGQSNTAQTNTHAAVCGGSTNTASGQYSFVGGGNQCAATGSTSAVVGGQLNTASSTFAFIGGGINNAASSAYAIIVGGSNNSASGQYAFISGGRYGTTRSIEGNHVFPACAAPIASVAGVTQSALLLLGRQTTDATATVLTSNTSAAGTTNQVILPNNSAYSFSGEVIAGVTAAGNTARWTIDGAIKRGANAASTTMVGTPTVTMTHFDAGAATWVVAVTADTTNGGIAVTVTGAAATTIRWVCRIDTTEMTY